MTRKNYAAYKDGLAVVNLTPAKVKQIERGFCVKAILQNGHRQKIRVRLKPARKLSIYEENVLLKKELAKARQILSGHDVVKAVC